MICSKDNHLQSEKTRERFGLMPSSALVPHVLNYDSYAMQLIWDYQSGKNTAASCLLVSLGWSERSLKFDMDSPLHVTVP